MSQEDTPASSAGTRAADLLASGRKKYALAQARLQQRQHELALLSLIGCLEDVFRGHLLLHNNAHASADWTELLATLQSQSEPAMTEDEARRLNRMQRLRTCITRGEPVTLTDDTMLAYQQFAAALLVRYGVVVVAPETPWYGARSEYSRKPRQTRQHYGQRRSFARLLPVVLIVLIFVVGAGATLMLQQGQAIPQAVFRFRPAAGFAPEATPLVAESTPALLAGQTVFVRKDVVDGLPLREQPGISATVPIRLYLSIGTAMEVLDGPVLKDGLVWWKVSAANQEGWCAEEFLEVR